MTERPQYVNHDMGIYPKKVFDDLQAIYLRSLVCKEVIEEYRQKPLGQHSEPLQRLLYYFWRLPLNQRYGIKLESTSGLFQVIRFSGVRGIAPVLVDSATYQSVDQAYFRIFQKHIEDLLESKNG